MASRNKTVVSASRRIDLPACFPDELAARILEIGTPNIHTLVLWTKDPCHLLRQGALRHAVMSVDSIYLHLTVTGLGGTVLEPGVPPWQRVMSMIPDLLRLPNIKAQAICLRYDPLASFVMQHGETFGNLDPHLFKEISAAAAKTGMTTVRTSLMTPYAKVRRRLAQAGIALDPDLDQKGREFIDRVMLPGCQSLGLVLCTCVNPDQDAPGCIDAQTLVSLHPGCAPCSRARDRSQRPGCHCTASLDIGSYFTCPHGCLYCYGNPLKQNINFK